jgi:protein-disulfide isomerase
LNRNPKTVRRGLMILLGVIMLFAPIVVHGQFLGTGARDRFLDTSVLRPPAGAKVALVVFEDLGCPACAHAHPFEIDAVKQTHVALLRYDFPIDAHVWTFSGAVCARYVQDTYGPAMAEEFRSAVFKSQSMYSSEDDIHAFLAKFLEKHGKKMPTVLDPGGKLSKEVTADKELGKRLNVEFTPTVVVVTRNNYQVICGTKEGANDPAKILEVVKAAMAQAH